MAQAGTAQEEKRRLKKRQVRGRIRQYTLKLFVIFLTSKFFQPKRFSMDILQAV
jgi:hypothetical protein